MQINRHKQRDSNQIKGTEYISEKQYENLLTRKKIAKLDAVAQDFYLSFQEAEAGEFN